jgi:carbon storage regulator
MLVLTRKETQTIHIGNDIVIRIVQAGTSSVKIGIEAPRNVSIVRGELLVEENTPEPLARDAELFATRETTPARVGAA